MLEKIGKILARFLSKPRERGVAVATCTSDTLAATLQKGDILLIEGRSRISSAIKYLTQSTWSHAAFYIGDTLEKPQDGDEQNVLIEVDLNEGVRAIPLSMYCHYHTRICRPLGISDDELRQVINFMTDRIGYQYDLENIFDLARYFIQSPPVPQKHRRKLLAFGSGDPTKAICSSLIAQSFQQIQYPILPDIEEMDDPACKDCYEEILHIRHHSLFTPRDFDISPYFQIVKPTIEQGFDHHSLTWAEQNGRKITDSSFKTNTGRT